MKQPFSAVVGVETASQYRDLARTEFNRYAGEIAVGILMSEKTGLLGVPNRHGLVYPNFEDTKEIIAAKEGTGANQLPIIVHYNTDNPFQIGGQLSRALWRYGGKIDAVQVNGLRQPHLANLERFREEEPDVLLILQIDRELLGELQPEDIGNYAAKNSNVVDAVWLDGSGGQGEPLDAENLLPIIEEIKSANSQARIGVAGGLNPYNLQELLEPILERHPDVSWDAQSGVQMKVEGRRRFDVDEAKKFLLGSLVLRSISSK